MSTLASLQRGFADYLLQGDERAIRPLVSRDVDPGQRLGIYANAYRLRLQEALAVDYTLLAAWLGEVRFAELMDSYIDAHPSQHYNIRRYGHRMAEFLSRHSPWRDEPLLVELAEFEWVQGLSFDAVDARPLDAATVAALPAEDWPGLRITFHASLQRRDFYWNVHQLWEALQQGQILPAAHRFSRPQPWLFWRRGRRNRFVSLSDEAAEVIDAALAGNRFAQLCETLCRWHAETEVPVRAAALLKGWLAEGMVIALTPIDEEDENSA